MLIKDRAVDTMYLSSLILKTQMTHSGRHVVIPESGLLLNA